MDRRDFIKVAGMSASGFAFAVDDVSAAETDSKLGCAAMNKQEIRHTLTLLHTNDMHGHLDSWMGWEGDLRGRKLGGFDVLAAAIQQVRSETAANVLLVDTGDLIGDSMLAELTRGECLIAALNYLQYDAMTLGNHEPDFGEEVLTERIAQSQFTVLAANLTYKATGEHLALPYSIHDVCGLQVGILGLTYPKTPRTTAKANVDQLEYSDPKKAVEKYLPKMRSEGAELVIVLSHLGLAADIRLAEATQGIDVIVGGHSHNRMKEPQRVRETLIVQAGAFGSDLGRLDLEIQNGRILNFKRELIALDNKSIAHDSDARNWLEQQKAPHQSALAELVGKATDWLIRAQTLAGQQAGKRHEESPVDSLFADLLREAFDADAAFLPGVGYGVAIPPGAVTAAQLRQLVPHDGKIMTMSLTGAQVRKILEQALENLFSNDPAVNVGGMIQISGIRFRYAPDSAKGSRVTSLELDRGPWDESKRLRVVTNSMLAGGGHDQATFLEGYEIKEQGSQFQTLKDLTSKKRSIQTPPLGRISAQR
jgi:5'-nucleotidase / UDP-sugar diphosphatase